MTDGKAAGSNSLLAACAATIFAVSPRRAESASFSDILNPL
jgi:hypothetical protein